MGLLEASFYDDVMAAEMRLKQEIIFKTGTYDDLIDLPMDDLDRYGCPALVLAASRLFGKPDEQTITLATIAQYIFMADRTHGLVRDGQTEETQYPVLVGDYLYGKFFLELTKYHLNDLLEPLAEAIAVMSEGSIARWIATQKKEKPSGDEQTKIMGQERAYFTGLIVWLGARLFNAPLIFKELLESFGYKVGLAWAAYSNNSQAAVENFLKESYRILETLEAKTKLNLKPLYELHDFFATELLAEKN